MAKLHMKHWIAVLCALALLLILLTVTNFTNGTKDGMKYSQRRLAQTDEPVKPLAPCTEKIIIMESDFKDTNNVHENDVLQWDASKTRLDWQTSSLPERHDNFLIKNNHDIPHRTYFNQDFLIPNIVHYFWCGERVFKFENYLSVLSAFKFLRADKIIIHYFHRPQIDRHRYHQWFDNLIEEIPNFVLKYDESLKDCENDNNIKLSQILNILSERGGFYVNENVILTNPLTEIRRKHQIHALIRFSTQLDMNGIRDAILGGALLLKKGYFKNTPTSHMFSAYFRKEGYGRVKDIVTNCHTVEEFTNTKDNGGICVQMKEELFPYQIWEREDAFGALSRRLFYGSEAVLKPSPSNDNLIPKLCHYVWMGGAQMEFIAYLSVKSCLNVLKVDQVLLHGDQEPNGPYWQKLKTDPRVKFIYREWPETIFGNPVKDPSHVSDVFRVDLLIKYGGIYTDWDAVWVKPIEDLRGYDVVADYDWPDWHPPFPDKFNMGVLIAKKNAKFLHYFLDTMKKYQDGGDWYYNACLMPYKAYERHPDSLLVEKRLQVICFEYKCHPIWQPGYKDANIHHLNKSPFNWKTDVYAVHWTRPSPEEFTSEETLRSAHTMFAEIGKYILDKK